MFVARLCFLGLYLKRLRFRDLKNVGLANIELENTDVSQEKVDALVWMVFDSNSKGKCHLL